MKQMLMLLMAVSLMAACTDEENASVEVEKETATETVVKEEVASEEVVEEVEEEYEEEVADISESIELVEGTMKTISYYGTEESYAKYLQDGEGIIETNFDSFNVNSIFLLVDVEPNEEYAYQFGEKESVRAIAVFMNTENTTDMEVDYGGDVTIVTDTKEQVFAEDTLINNEVAGIYFGQVEEAGYYLIPLMDDTEPKNIKVSMEGPYKVIDGGVDPVNDQMGEEYKFELTAFDLSAE